MAQPRGIRRIIELAIDAASARRMKADAQRALDQATDPSKAQRNLSAVERGMEGIRGTALKVGAALGGVFAALKLGDFLADSVRAFREADAIWNRLAGTLETVGVRYASVKKEIQAAAQGLERRSTFDDEAFAQSLTTLVSISGDYAKSFRNVQVAADLAAAKQIDMETASQLVGKAMVGQTGTLARYGIVVKSTDDAVEVMRQRFAGMAENELKTSAGRIQQLSNFWSDFKEAVGEGVATSPAVTHMLDEMSGRAIGAADSMGSLTDSVGAFIDTILNLNRVVTAAGGWKQILFNPDFTSRLAAGFATVQEESRQQRANLRDIGGLERPEALNAREQFILHERVDAMRDTALNAKQLSERLADLDAQLRAVQARRDELAHPTSGSGGGGRTAGRTRSGSGGRNLARIDDVFIGGLGGDTAPFAEDRFLGDVGPSAQLRARIMAETKQQRAADKADEIAGMEDVKNAWLENHAEMLNSAQGVAMGMMDAFGEAFQMLFTEGGDAAEVMGNLFKGMAASLARELAHVASMKAAQDIAQGFEYLANAKPHQAALAFLAAAKWELLGGLAQGAAGAISGGGGGSNGGGLGAGGLSTRSAEDAKKSGPEIHIYVDGIDPSNPRHQQLAAAAVAGASERYGPNSRVTVHPRGPR
jgi:hypothetical protein